MAAEASAPFFSTLDITLIVGAVTAACIYFFMRRRTTNADKNNDVAKSFTVIPPPARVEDPSFISKMKNQNRNVVVFYGSQTGTAEDFANRLVKDAAKYGMKGVAVDPEECDMDDLTKLMSIDRSIALFCMATYGEGDPTDNAQEFYEWLQAGNSALPGLRYAVFALGNKTYEHFNSMGIYVDKRLSELEAARVFELGLGDDDGNIEEDFITWKEGLWPAICNTFGISAEAQDIHLRQYKLRLPTDPLSSDRLFSGEITRLGAFRHQRPPFDAKNPFLAPLRANRNLFKGGDRRCLFLSFDITNSRIRYETGDHVAVYPSNDPALVQRLGDRLGIDLDDAFYLDSLDEDSSKKHPFPCPCTYRVALSNYLDITNSPKTNVLGELAEYAAKEEEKSLLKLMASSSAEGKALYNDWIIRDRRTILGVLEDMPSVQPPVDHVCELLPRLQARYYSISSSPKVHPSEIHVTAVVLRYETRIGRQMEGVATCWLDKMDGVEKEAESEERRAPLVPVYVRRSQFRLPFKSVTPVIMVGPGSGFAPFRGFIQERAFAKEQGKPVGPMILYYGCRHADQDYLYEEELQKYKEDGVLSDLYVAFSRDQAQKVYVHHLMRQEANRKQLWDIFENGGHFYVCGDAKNMARDVHATLEEILTTEGGMDIEGAKAYLKKMQNRGRYSSDVWS